MFAYLGPVIFGVAIVGSAIAYALSLSQARTQLVRVVVSIGAEGEEQRFVRNLPAAFVEVLITKLRRATDDEEQFVDTGRVRTV
jgi:hypothetical protein